MKKGNISVIAFLALFALALALPGGALAAFVGKPAPDYTLKTLDGETVRGKDMVGKKPVMMVFWATWCPVCEEGIPGIKRIHERLAPRGLEVVAVNVGVNDSEGKARKYVGKYGIDYPVAFDRGSEVTRKFGIRGTPTVVIVDAGGIVRYRSAGLPEDLEERFDDLAVK